MQAGKAGKRDRFASWPSLERARPIVKWILSWNTCILIVASCGIDILSTILWLIILLFVFLPVYLAFACDAYAPDLSMYYCKAHWRLLLRSIKRLQHFCVDLRVGHDRPWRSLIVICRSGSCDSYLSAERQDWHAQMNHYSIKSHE